MQPIIQVVIGGTNSPLKERLRDGVIWGERVYNLVFKREQSLMVNIKLAMATMSALSIFSFTRSQIF